MQKKADRVHGHEVLRMMLESREGYDEKNLERAIAERFGSETRFYTCSADNMTAAELIRFLMERGKFVAGKKGFTTERSKICDHDELQAD